MAEPKKELLLKTVNLSKSYASPGDQKGLDNRLHVLKDINLEIYQGEMVSIVGHSGAGKSSLLHVLGTLDEPSEGKIYFREQDVFALSPKKLAAFRNAEIGFVFQFHHLLAELSALENVMLPLLIAGEAPKPSEKKALHYLSLVGLSHRAKHKPGELSGGEAQRVAIARALVRQPKVIFADEPTGNLDTQTSDRIHQLLVDLNRQLNTTFVVVTHNLRLAWLLHRHLLLDSGSVRELSQDEAPEGFISQGNAIHA